MKRFEPTPSDPSDRPVPNDITRPLVAALAAALFAWPLPRAQAAPQGGVVTHGSATIREHGRTTTVDQRSERAVIDWRSFGIRSDESVVFDQPNANAVVLNRVIGGERSVIDGALRANGQVFLVNASGVLFSRGSRVDVGGLVASTLPIRDADFLAARARFGADGDTASDAASVRNDGTLRAAAGGYIALLGPRVVNDGRIVAPRGDVALAAGERVALQLAGHELVNLTIERGALQALVSNGGVVIADGGSIVLTARAADELLGSQVNQDGVLRARTISDLTGDIRIDAQGGTARIDGRLDASATTGDGGRIETSGQQVQVAEGATLTTAAAHGRTGQWTVDPDGFVVGTGGDISAATLERQLARSNVTLHSTDGHGANGDLAVNEAVSWTADTRLTLVATHNVEVHAPITAHGDAASVALRVGGDYLIDTAHSGAITLEGRHARFSVNGQAYTLIHDIDELAALTSPVRDAQGNPVIDPYTGHWQYTSASGHYALAGDLDASGHRYEVAVIHGLTGTLTGLGHTVSHLRIRSQTPYANGEYEPAAFIGSLGGDGVSARLRDLQLTDLRVTGGNTSDPAAASAAGLVGTNAGRIDHVAVQGRITGSSSVGGLVGTNLASGTIDHATVAIDINARNGGVDIGGAVGMNFGSMEDTTASGRIRSAGISLGDGPGLQSSREIGGLVGANFGFVRRCVADVDIHAVNSTQIGGLVGINHGEDGVHGLIADASAHGDIVLDWTNTGVFGEDIGGLVGSNVGGVIRNVSATGNIVVNSTASSGGVTWPTQHIGGLVGSNETFFGVGGTITHGSASGNVTGNGQTWDVGGAVGYNLDGTLSGLHASGDVNAGNLGQNVGGLVGTNLLGNIGDSSASGNVTGGSVVGGLVGSNGNGGYGTIDGSTATGSVTAADGSTGGLTGSNAGGVSDSSYRDAPAETAAGQLGERSIAELGDAERPASDDADAQARSLPADRAAIGEAIVVRRTPRYGASVRTIEVDGTVYELEDRPARPAASAASTASAPASAPVRPAAPAR